MSTPSIALNVNALIFKRQHKVLMNPIAQHQIGLVITIVMMKTIILNVVMMEVIVVETMSTPHTALNVNVLSFKKQHKPLDQIANYHIGLAITTVTMKTTILNA